MAKFEIELRGRLTLDQKNKLQDFLCTNGKLVREYERTQWCFGLSHDKKIDLRIKKTNGQAEFSLKVGRLGNANRKEISIPILPDKVDQAFEFLKFLGHREGVKAIRNAKIYTYKNIEWAIVEVPNHSFYFEAEILVDNKSDGIAAQEEIRRVADELFLKVDSPNEIVEYIKILDKEANKLFKL